MPAILGDPSTRPFFMTISSLTSYLALSQHSNYPKEIIYFTLFLFYSQGEECRSPFVINSNDDSCSSLSVDDVQNSALPAEDVPPTEEVGPLEAVPPTTEGPNDKVNGLHRLL